MIAGDNPNRRLLIVNADDYGLTEGISRGILAAHRDGIVTSTSVLAVGPAYAKAAPWLDDAPCLGVGVHLAAVGEDPPLLSAPEIPTLLDRRGHFHNTYGVFLARAAAGRVDPDDLRREFDAQLCLVRQTLIPITHLDAHQHLHLWPSVAKVVIELARSSGIPAVRVPRMRKVGLVGLGVTLLARRLQLQAAAAGLVTPGDAVGIECAGRIDSEELPRVLDRLARVGKQAVEMTVHPGEDDDPERDRYRWGFRWGDELAALSGPTARALVADRGFRLATYADLPAN